jgi:flagellin
LGILTGTTGTALATTVVGATTGGPGAFTPGPVSVRVTGGGLSTPTTITFDATVNTVDKAITSLINQVSNDANLKAAGITAAGGSAGTSALTFTSARGEKFNVVVTGDTANALGFGTFLAGQSNATDYATLTGSVPYDNTTQYGTTGMEVSLNGAASSGNPITVNLDAGNATAATKAATADSDQHGNTVTFSIDGGGAVSVTLAVGDVNASLAATKINATGGINVTASVDSTGKLKIVSNTLGAHSLTIAGTNTYAGLNGVYRGASRTDTDLRDALNAAFSANSNLQKAGLQASVDGSHNVTIASNNGTYFRVNAAGTAATANIGFGVAGATYTGATVGNSNISVADSSGATNTQAIDFTALTYGSDDQAITVSANDSTGALQTKTITLKNDGASNRYGRSIDEAVNYINTQLQQSNNATLQKIVAVKEINGVTEQINFLSSLNRFSVGLGSSANANGFNAGAAASEDSQLLGAGANVSIEGKASALLAVSAVAAAIGTLGAAQAAVGKGQNQLNYAIGLAQSQISNFSAAESRIRDADVAAEAANLTKAQVLQQASMAAMAQANSAPQAVLSLLKG